MYPKNVEDFLVRSEEVVKTHTQHDAFIIISSELNHSEGRYLNECIVAFNIIRYEEVLNWIEKNAYRAGNISTSWGHLAASSLFTWSRAINWLEQGRPLSLIALDALIFCTTLGERRDQSLWMRQIKPTLIDIPKLDFVARTLQEYLKKDSVPRVKNAVDRIIKNIFDA